MNELSLAYEWVMSHIWMSHVSHKSHSSGNSERESIEESRFWQFREGVNRQPLGNPAPLGYPLSVSNFKKKKLLSRNWNLRSLQNVCTSVACVCVYLSESIYAWRVSFKRVFCRSCLTELFCMLQHTATHRGLTATHCNTVVSCRSLSPPSTQRDLTVTLCNTGMSKLYRRLFHTATNCNTLQHTATYCNTLQHTATHCNTLQHTATFCNKLQHPATPVYALQHTATHCNTL